MIFRSSSLFLPYCDSVVISLVLVEEENGVPGQNQCLTPNHWQLWQLSHIPAVIRTSAVVRDSAQSITTGLSWQDGMRTVERDSVELYGEDEDEEE